MQQLRLLTHVTTAQGDPKGGLRALLGAALGSARYLGLCPAPCQNSD
jgi:hypothetical protein